MTERIGISGVRDLSASLDGDETADRVVVACPPHPQMRGDRHDGRLQAVSDTLTADGVACLRFDYGPWDEGRGERTDVRTALRWARERFDRVGLFGFSFGAAMAILASVPGDHPTPDALAALAPAAQVSDRSVVDALADITCPATIVYGERDDTAEWEPVVERARELGIPVTGLPADHFFVGQQDKVADAIGSFLLDHV